MKKKPEPVKLFRGGQEVELFKSPNLIAIKLKNGATNEHAFHHILSRTRNRKHVRMAGMNFTQRSVVFRCDVEDRDEFMAQIRANTEVQYCSHVFHRRAEADDVDGEIGLDNKVFIEAAQSLTSEEIREIERKYHLRKVWTLDPEENQAFIFELTESATVNPIKVCHAIYQEHEYLAEPCLIEPKSNKAIPNTPGFRHQWHLHNIGQGGGKVHADCNAVEAWDYTYGDANITVAIIDDGFDLTHPDFKGEGKIVAPYDATGSDFDPSPDFPREKHGTSCAGVAIASRFHGYSVGIAPDCSFMPIRHSGKLGDYEEAKAFEHAYLNGADIISCSWGPYDAYQNAFWPMPRATQRIIDKCVTKGRGGKGIPIFFAAGNGEEPLDLDGYANYKNVIAIAACTDQDEKAIYSDYGKNVWVTAPSSGGASSIFTTDRQGLAGYDPINDYTSNFGGTSSATPLVAGIVGLMLSVNPTLSVKVIKKILKESATPIQENNPIEYIDTWGNKFSDEYDADGHSKAFGWGKVNAGYAVKLALALKC